MPSRPALRTADRGLAIGIVSFIAALVLLALVYTLLNPAADQLFSMTSSQASSQQATDAIARRRKIWENILFYGVFLCGLFILARAVFESRRPG